MANEAPEEVSPNGQPLTAPRPPLAVEAGVSMAVRRDLQLLRAHARSVHQSPALMESLVAIAFVLLVGVIVLLLVAKGDD